MEITKETIYWSDTENNRGFKLLRLSLAFRKAAITNPNAYIQMLGTFPLSSGTEMPNLAKSSFAKHMRESRDYLVSRGVWQQSVDAYVFSIGAPTTEFFYSLTLRDDTRWKPEPAAYWISIDDVMWSGMSEIAKETIAWSDTENNRGFKLLRLSYAFRKAAITNPKAYIRMVGGFPHSSGSEFSNYTKRQYVGHMRESRDYLVSRGVWEKSIDGFILLTEAPTTEFFYSLTLRQDDRKPFYSGFMTLDEVMERELKASNDKDKDEMAKYVIDPFSADQTVKAQLEVELFDGKTPLRLPGTLKATLEMKGDKVKDVGVEWELVKREIAKQILSGKVTNVVFKFSIAGKQDLTAVSARQIFGAWGSEAKASIELEVRRNNSNILFKVEWGAKVDNDGRVKWVLEFSF